MTEPNSEPETMANVAKLIQVGDKKLEIPKYRMTEREIKRYEKELQALMQSHRDHWNTPLEDFNTPPREIPYPGEDTPKVDPIALYNDLYERQLAKNCSRCGFHFIYHVEHHQSFFKIHEYDGPERFYHEIFELVRDTVYTNGKCDDPWYDVCKKCQADMKTGTPFDRHPNLLKAQRALADYEEQERKRNTIQSHVVERITAEIKERRRIEREQRDKELEEERKQKEEAEHKRLVEAGMADKKSTKGGKKNE